METIIIFSFIFSLIATGLSLVRILRTHKESKRKRQADLFLNVTNLVRIIEDEKSIQSRRALRKSKHLTQLKEDEISNNKGIIIIIII